MCSKFWNTIGIMGIATMIFGAAEVPSAIGGEDFAEAPHIEIIMANVTSDNTRDGGYFLKKIVEEHTNGTVVIDLFNDNVLGDDLTVSQMCMQGDIGITVTAMSPLASMYPDFYAFDAPFMFIDKADAYRKLDGKYGQLILDGLEAINLKGLTYWESGFRHLTNNRIAAVVPDDIKNLKIRVMTNEVHIATWKALGANPTPMSFSELFTALQQGTVDGEEMPLGVMFGNKFHEVQK
jgi:tripartite ATP-independent transporter DctP family solute receptor